MVKQPANQEGNPALEGDNQVFAKFDEFFGEVYGDGGVFDRKTKHLIAPAASLLAVCVLAG